MKKLEISRSTKSVSGTSFHGHTITATLDQLKSKLGKPSYSTKDSHEKVQNEWDLEIDGHVFTVYDWKEYYIIRGNDTVEWHIGAHSSLVSGYAQREMIELLEK
jgi:hypothetical protein